MRELKQFEDHFAKKHDGIIFAKHLRDKSELFQDTFGDNQVIAFDSSTFKLV